MPRQMNLFDELIIDNFAGGGGASTGTVRGSSCQSESTGAVREENRDYERIRGGFGGMSDRHLFRGKRINKDIWDIGYLSWHENNQNPKAHLTILGKEIGRALYNEVDPATLGQCTGLIAEKSYRGKSREDLLIFEWDIVNIIGDNGGVWVIGGA